jgi:hypothetical protein
MIGLAAGFVAARRLWPGRPDVLGTTLCLASAFGFVSLIQYVWLVAGKPGLAALAALECAALGAALLIPRARASAAAPGGASPTPRALRVLLILASTAAAIAMVHTFRAFPHGAWDAVDLWNLRAVGFLRGGLDATLATARHADYPLLLPLAIAHAWAWTGQQEIVPVAVAVVFAACSVGILRGASARMGGARASAIVTIVLLASPLWAFQAASQRADVPLSCFVLGTAAALALHARSREPRLLVLAGVQLGCALWTKNEGLLFALAVTAAWLATSGRSERRSAWRIALGAAPFALALLHHKLTCGATTDLIAGQGALTWERLGDADRWLATAAAFAREGAFEAIVAGALFVILARDPGGGAPSGASFVWITLALVLAGDFAVYVLTPRDLAWHLTSSLDRVLLQIWPLALFAVGATASDRARAR